MAKTEKTIKSASRVRFNIVDFVLIIAVLACLCGVYLRYNLSEEFGSKTEMGEYVLSFEINGIRYTSADAFPEGDKFFLDGKDTVLGTVLAIDSTSPAEIIYTDPRGDYKTIYYPEDSRIDLTGRLLSEGMMTDRGYMLGGNTHITPGQGYYIESPRINVSLTITAIEPASAGD